MARALIAFTGLAGSGKSTAADHLVQAHQFTRLRFAGPIKAMCRALGLTDEQVDGGQKEVPCQLLTHANFSLLLERIPDAFQWMGVRPPMGTRRGPYGEPMLNMRSYQFASAALVGIITQAITEGESQGGATPRLLMQLIGTEWAREQIADDFWVRLMRYRVEQSPNTPFVIDDCRFPNEAEAIEELGGQIIRIDRPGAGIGEGHASEAFIKHLRFTGILVNDGSIHDLQRTLDAILHKAPAE
jgi:hypothetical protein